MNKFLTLVLLVAPAATNTAEVKLGSLPGAAGRWRA